jgi:hypothetical protein
MEYLFDKMHEEKAKPIPEEELEESNVHYFGSINF